MILGVIAIAHGLRPDLAVRLQEPVFSWSGWRAALLTGVLAAIAAFRVSLPEASRWWVMLPVPALVLWVSTHRLWLPDRLGAASDPTACAWVKRSALCHAVDDQRAAVGWRCS